jgi:hypothetical protein
MSMQLIRRRKKTHTHTQNTVCCFVPYNSARKQMCLGFLFFSVHISIKENRTTSQNTITVHNRQEKTHLLFFF